MSDETKCPKCGSGLVIQISNQKHCNSCSFEFAIEKNPIAKRARGEPTKIGYVSRNTKT
jgi:hypothetical protein